MTSFLHWVDIHYHSTRHLLFGPHSYKTVAQSFELPAKTDGDSFFEILSWHFVANRKKWIFEYV